MTDSSNGSRYGRFIPSEEIGRVTQWRFGAVDETARAAEAAAALLEAAEAASHHPDTLARIEAAREEAFAAGHAQGRAEAARAGAQQLDDYIAGEGRAAAERLAAVVAAAAEGLDASQARIAQGVLDIACALARQVLRRELSINPAALQPVIREALATLLAEGRPATVRLHPQDLDRLRPSLQAEFGSAPVAWAADAQVPPGGCLVEAAGTVIDGRLEARWSRAVATLGRDDAWEPTTAPAADADGAAEEGA